MDRLGIGELFWLTHEAVIGVDLATERVVLWNPSAERIFGYPAAEAMGMALDRLVPDAYLPAHHAGLDRYRNERRGSTARRRAPRRGPGEAQGR